MTTSRVMTLLASKALCTGQHVFNNNINIITITLTCKAFLSLRRVGALSLMRMVVTSNTMVINFNLVWISMHFVLVVLEIMSNTNANFL